MIPLEKISEIAAAKGEIAAITTDDSSVSWDEFNKIVDGLVGNISHHYKSSPLDTICFLSPNRKELVFLASASATLKIPFIGLDYSFDTQTLHDILNSTNCDLLIVSSTYCKKAGIDIDKVAGGVAILDLDSCHCTALAYSELARITSPGTRVDGTARSYVGISFTSGTSGVPKAVMRSQSFDSRRFSYFTTRYGFGANDKHLLAIPIYHAAGSGWARLFLQLGATLVIAPFENFELTMRVLKNEGITTTVMTPPMLDAMLKESEKHQFDLSTSQLRFLLVGGKHFPTTLKKRSLEVLGAVVYEYYGTTETGVNTIAEPSDLLEKITSVGRVFDGNYLQIVGDKHEQLSAGQVGRISVCSYMNMDSYADSQCENVVIGGRNYLLTPETGFIDDDGYLYLLNRTSGSVISDLFSVENAILELPCVQDVSLFPADSSSPVCDCALVVRKDSMRNIDIVCKKVFELSLKKGVLVRSASVVNELPYTPTGKVRASRLKETLEKKTLARIDCIVETELDTGASLLPAADERLTTSGQSAPVSALTQTIQAIKKVSPVAHSGAPSIIKSGSIKSKDNTMSPLMRFLFGILCLVVTTLAWGAMFPIAKNALTTLDAVHISLVRYGLASIILLIMLAVAEGPRSLLPGKHLLKLWFFGSLGFAGFSILAFAGLAHTEAQHGAIVMATMPLLSVLMLWLIQGKRPSPPVFGFIALAFLGVVLVVTQGDIRSLQGGALLPTLVILLGASCWVVYTLGSSYVENISVLRYTALSAGLGSVTIAIIALATNTLGVTTMPDVSTLLQIKWELAFLVIIAGVMAVFSWNLGIKALGPTNGVLFINLVPITAFAIEYVRGADINQAEILGAITTISALVFCNLYGRGLFKSLPGFGLKIKAA